MAGFLGRIRRSSKPTTFLEAGPAEWAGPFVFMLSGTSHFIVHRHMTAPAMALPVVPAATGSLCERAMTVGLHLSAWNGQRLDRQTTAEVLQERQASKDAGQFAKFLVPPKALERVTKAHGHARLRHYRLTLPWGEAGVRILSAPAFFDYSTAMGEERSNCETAYREFVAEYPQLLADAPRRLAKLFDKNDFPDPSTIHLKFGFRLEVLPVPDKGDFRVALGAEIEADIRASIEQTVTERFASAQQDLWERLLDAVKHFAVTMKQDDKVFRDSTFHKLGDLARLAPKLSLTPDPKLEAVCNEIIALTAGIQPTDLRDNPLLRTHTARKAQVTLGRIERAIQGAF